MHRPTSTEEGALNLTHTFLGDLIVNLEKDGFFTEVYNPLGLCSAGTLESVFDDDAAGTPNACPPPATLPPSSPLAPPPNDISNVLPGTFSLSVEDLQPEDTGQVQSWGFAADVTCTLLPPPGDSCVGGPNTLCLNDDRFEVEVEWKRRNGSQGMGNAVTLTDDTGYFWFFDDKNVELVVKVLDACGGQFDRFWVFAAGLTDVEVKLTVTDLESDEVQEYFNPLGMPFDPIQDTDAFATCP